MQHWIASIVLMLVAGSAHASGSEVECFERATVDISEVTSPIEILPARDRRDSIEVLVPIDCDSGAALVPGNIPEAIAWLDIALPVDLKAALLHGEYAEPYTTSPYGSSVMSDLFRYFSDRWSLGPDHPLCDSADVKTRIANDDGPCFFILVDLLRERYLAGAARETPALDRPRAVSDKNVAGVDPARVDSLFGKRVADESVSVLGCVVADPMAFSGNHAFLATRCDLDTDGYPSELEQLSVDLVPADRHLKKAMFKETSGCSVVRGRFFPYSDDLDDGVVPSGNLTSEHGLIEVEFVSAAGASCET